MKLSVILRAMLTMLLALPLAAGNAADAEPGVLPRLEATLLGGKPYALADSRGSVLLLVFWSPSSLASRKSLPELQRFFAEYAARGVGVLALATTGDTEAIRQVADARGVQVPLGVLGPNDLGPLTEAQLPAVRVFDRAGRLVGGHDGLFRLRDLQRAIEAALAE